jgi:signal transduction histidine kinase
MSRITSGKLRLDVQPIEPVSFIEAAIETLSPAATAKGVRVEKRLDTTAGPMMGDPNRLQQIVWNLLSNAIKFTPNGGKVQVVLERLNSQIEITVSDTGVGITSEFLPYVFDRFRQEDASTTRHFGGLGLGLSIVKRLVELHGGSVRVHSPGEGRGANFIVSLPLMVDRNLTNGDPLHLRTNSAAALEFKRSDLSGLRVLVVDDEEDARELIKRILIECDA